VRHLNSLFFPLLLSLLSAGLLTAQDEESNQGALILISTEGTVWYLDEKETQQEDIKIGSIIPSSYMVETGKDGKLTGLLSNGTLLTLTENTRMKVATFEQEPFKDDGRKLADLLGEPSQSKVDLELEYGSLVVKTKKLSKGSVLNIISPLGVAGIRGTEFQMASNPGQGVQLDVTESTVAFTPPGGGQPIPVSQGNGLSVSPSGVPTQRPVNPVVATKIESTNQAATEATQNVSMGEVVSAVQQSTQESKKETSEESISTSETDEVGDEESAEPDDSEPAPKEDKSSDDSKKEEPVSSESEPSGEQDNQQIEMQQSNEGQSNQNLPTEKSEEGETFKGENNPAQAEGSGKQTKEPGKTVQSSSNASSKPSKVEKVSTGNIRVEQPDKAMLLENNPGLKNNQKLAKFGLSKEQQEKFERLSPRAREEIVKESPQVVRRLLSMNEFEGDKSDLFYSHEQVTRELLLTMQDDVMINLLDPNVDSVLLKESLQKINHGVVRPENIPDREPDLVINARAIALGDKLKEQGNSDLMEDLLEMSGGVLNEHWLRTGEIAEVLTRNLEVNDFTSMESFSAEEVFGNPFFPELANVYDQLELDALVNGADKVMGADRLIVRENARAFGSHFSQGVKEVVLMSKSSMDFQGDFTWEAEQKDGARLVLMTTGDFKIKEETTLRSATSDLVLATRENLLLKQVDLHGDREVTIRGLRDVVLNDVKIGASELARIKARRDLNVDGLGFKRDVSRIIMEATTIRLRNVDFPGASQVRLNSLKGPIDGRYPNFGTAIPAAQQIGRVNFIHNVKSGGNLLHDRPSFDLHGKNIKIGTIPRP
jgi:hypothetical protein